MNTPNLPTDSLYKFLALSGVFLLVVSVFLPARLVYEAEIEVERVAGEATASRHEQRLALGPEYADALERLGPGPTDWTKVSEAERARIDSLAALASDSAHEEFNAAFARLQAASAEVERQLFEAYYWRIVGRTGATVGFGLAVFGFGLWWWRLQRHLDQIVARQANPPEPPATGRRHKFE